MTEPRTHPVRAAIMLTAVMCATAGAIDVIAYLIYEKIFIANMTGNTVLFAASALQQKWGEAALRIGVILSFLCGIFITRAGLRKLAASLEKRTRLVALAIEFILLITLVLVPYPHSARVALLVLLAFALGAQNDAFRNISGIRLNTAFITGDLEDLGAAPADSKDSDHREQSRKRAAIFFTTWTAYAAGALLGAYGAFHLREKALLIPAGLVVIAAALVAATPPGDCLNNLE
jgi:uncharacterized membrane protein YoaK (UPF0700 family)